MVKRSAAGITAEGRGDTTMTPVLPAGDSLFAESETLPIVDELFVSQIAAFSTDVGLVDTIEVTGQDVTGTFVDAVSATAALVAFLDDVTISPTMAVAVGESLVSSLDDNNPQINESVGVSATATVILDDLTVSVFETVVVDASLTVDETSLQALISDNFGINESTVFDFDADAPAVEQLGVSDSVAFILETPSQWGSWTWLDGAIVIQAGGVVTAWEDQSSNGRDYGQTNAALRPTALADGVQFADVERIQRTLTGPSLSVPFTIYFVAEVPSGPTSPQTVIAQRRSGGTAIGWAIDMASEAAA